MSDNLSEAAGPIGAQIRDLRLAKGWTLQTLAERVGTSAPTMHRYEGGWDRFELATLRKIAIALDARLLVRLVPNEDEEEIAAVLPEDLVELIAPVFWDKALTAADLEEYPDWVLRRVLMYGTRDQATAVCAHFGDQAVLEAVHHRSVDARTRRYWELMLGESTGAPEGPRR